MSVGVSVFLCVSLSLSLSLCVCVFAFALMSVFLRGLQCCVYPPFLQLYTIVSMLILFYIFFLAGQPRSARSLHWRCICTGAVKALTLRPNVERSLLKVLFFFKSIFF